MRKVYVSNPIMLAYMDRYAMPPRDQCSQPELSRTSNLYVYLSFCPLIRVDCFRSVFCLNRSGISQNENLYNAKAITRMDSAHMEMKRRWMRKTTYKKN